MVPSPKLATCESIPFTTMLRAIKRLQRSVVNYAPQIMAIFLNTEFSVTDTANLPAALADKYLAWRASFCPEDTYFSDYVKDASTEELLRVYDSLLPFITEERLLSSGGEGCFHFAWGTLTGALVLRGISRAKLELRWTSGNTPLAPK